jgi:hypothetical protein
VVPSISSLSNIQSMNDVGIFELPTSIVSVPMMPLASHKERPHRFAMGSILKGGVKGEPSVPLNVGNHIGIHNIRGIRGRHFIPV